MTVTRTRACLLLVGLLAGPATAPAATFGAFGLDLAGGDPTARPGTDFYRYANGHWLATERIPDDRTSWSPFTTLAEQAEADVREILEAAAAAHAPAGTPAQKLGDFYAAFLDTDAIDARGLAPAAAALGEIDAARSHAAVARLMARGDLGLPAPIDLSVTLDRKNPDRYVVNVTHGGLSLPDRDFYLRDDEQFAALRRQFEAHVERLLTLAGRPDPAGSARAILALETGIARLHWPRAERRDRDKTYNARSRAELATLAPEYPWDAMFSAAELGGVRDVIVAEVTAIEPLARLFRATPVESWRQYLAYQYLRSRARVLTGTIDREVFDFYGHQLSGQPQLKMRWRRAVDATNGALGEAVGREYVARHFTPAARQQATELVEKLRAAYGERLAAVPWMSGPSRGAAAGKLATVRAKVGYPDHWRDYRGLDVRRNDAFGNLTRAALYEWRRDAARLAKRSDRDEWFVSPQTVNAYYNPVFNEIVVPAAILQPPFFDSAADAAVNYGGIGGVIGHEMGHGFDDQGAKSDARGILHAWWSAEDVAAFQQLGDRLAGQYAAFEALPGLRVNGRLTLGENIGDLGGLTVALDAYRISLAGRPAPVLAGLSGEQRFFLGWAQVWRRLDRDETLRNLLLSDPHSPARFRVNGVVRNMDAWYSAFDVAPGDPLYLPSAERVRIW